MAILLGPMANAAAEIYQSHSGRFIRLPRQHFWREAKVIENPRAYILCSWEFFTVGNWDRRTARQSGARGVLVVVVCAVRGLCHVF